MRRTRPEPFWISLACGLSAAALMLSAPVFAAVPQLPGGPLVQIISTEDHDDHLDIVVLLSCSVRYISNMPVNHGTSTTLSLRLGPDCGVLQSRFTSELPPIGGDGQLLTGARIDAVAAGEVALQLTWSRELDFAVAPSPSGYELRIRLMHTAARKPRVLVTDATSERYVVNLDSALSVFDQQAVQQAANRLQVQAYESQIDIESQHWYRLRVGPFASRQEADRVLTQALPTYPRAFVAVNDEETDLADATQGGAEPAQERGPADPPLPDAERDRMLRDARAALAKHQYPQAVDLLNRLLRQPEYPGRADAQELLGLVRERAGELAQAKAEYQQYLRAYPHGAGLERVQARLRALLNAAQTARSTGEFGGAASRRWSMAGSAAVTYQYERDQSGSSGTTGGASASNTALVYGDLLLRERGTRYDVTTRIDAGYTKTFGQVAVGSQDRTTAAYIELTDRLLALTGRVGRQSMASQGVIGLFDGLYLSYQPSSLISVSAAVGLPAYTGYSAASGNSRFATLTAEFDPFHQAWIFDTYVVDATQDGTTDRRSVGFQVRHGVPGRTLAMLVDYDVAFQELNSATLIGNARIGSSWVLGFDADHRRSPLLEMSNALIGQNTTDLNALAQQFTPSQIRQLALDRTATSDTAVLSASRSFGERWNFMVDIAALQLGSTPGSGGVAATPATGLDKSATIQLSGSSLLQADDLQILGLRYDDSPLSRSATVSWDARFAVGGRWRLGPRLSVEQLNQPTQGGKQLLYLPQLRGDWTGRVSVIEFTAGYQILQQTLDSQGDVSSLQQRSLYLSAAYRMRF